MTYYSCNDVGVPPCPTCNQVIKDDEAVIRCHHACKRLFHKNCINSEVIKLLGYYLHLENLKWICEREDCVNDILIKKKKKKEYSSYDSKIIHKLKELKRRTCNREKFSKILSETTRDARRQKRMIQIIP